MKTSTEILKEAGLLISTPLEDKRRELTTQGIPWVEFEAKAGKAITYWQGHRKHYLFFDKNEKRI